jgi:hypothetical protein
MATRTKAKAARSAPRKSAPEEAPAPPPPPEENPPPEAEAAPPVRRGRPCAICLKGHLRWREWVHRLARHCRTRAPELIDRALIELAEREGFRPRCPER